MIPTLIAVALLLLAFAKGLPDTYFVVLRWTVCATAIYRGALALHAKHRWWAALFVGIAVLFNPLAPVHMPRAAWLAADAVVALALLGSLRALRRAEITNETERQGAAPCVATSGSEGRSREAPAEPQR